MNYSSIILGKPASTLYYAKILKVSLTLPNAVYGHQFRQKGIERTVSVSRKILIEAP